MEKAFVETQSWKDTVFVICTMDVKPDTTSDTPSEGVIVNGVVFSPNDLADAHRAFIRFDRDGSGAIDTKELTSVLRSMGQNPTDAEVHDMINEVDVDGSGVVEFEEFVQFIARLMKDENPDNDIRECYRRFDPENEGFVHVDELRFVLRNLPVRLAPVEIEEMIEAADPLGRGKISFHEFKSIMGR